MFEIYVNMLGEVDRSDCDRGMVRSSDTQNFAVVHHHNEHIEMEANREGKDLSREVSSYTFFNRLSCIGGPGHV
ncbi:hypothetical protein PISMIDRAFT_686028, partial [Pisolithus microcarpus 441]